MKNDPLKELEQFKNNMWDFYDTYGRSFAWRNVDDPYKVVISEVMLQQTQTSRVVQKYEQFLTEFRSFNMLAQASLRDVLSVWQGLGYNRRGMYLHQCAQKIVTNYNAAVPQDPNILEKLPGIGPATASSICAFAFNKPTVFIETNIRAVFLHFFFAGKQNVYDKDIMPLVAKTVDQENPREWYYALMDYGVMLKKTMPNPSKASKHYAKQSSFDGSDRQIRGRIIALLADINELSLSELRRKIGCTPERFDRIADRLLKEGIIKKRKQMLYIP